MKNNGIAEIINGLLIECRRGDITRQPEMDAVVNAANAELRPGGGVAGAIHRAAGPELNRACRPLAPIKPGEAVITPAFNLPNRYVIHCLGPIYGVNKPEAKLLADCYQNALRRAEENQLQSVAFPAISTGIFGYPPAEAAPTALAAVAESAPSLKTVKTVRFVLFGRTAYEIHAQALLNLAGKTSTPPR